MNVPRFVSGPLRRLRHAGRMNLLHWFSLVSFVAVAMVSLAQAVVLAWFVEGQLLRHDAEISRQLVQSVVDTPAVKAYFSDGTAPGGRESFEDFFSHAAAMPDVLRANVYAADGRMLWSSDPALVGSHFDGNEELAEALRGEIVAHRGAVSGTQHVSKPEHVRLARTQTHFVENYLPVYRDAAGAGAPIGVVELYRLPSTLNEAMRNSAVVVWAGAIAGGAVVYLSTLGLVRRASRLMQEQRARMVEAETLALVGEIAASVAHSIRNPLAAIRSGAELQVEMGTDAPKDLAREAVHHVDRIEHLVRTLLNYAHDRSEAQGQTELWPVLQEAVERFEPSFAAQGKTLRLEFDAKALPLPPVPGERVLLVQVLNSLLANALEATAAGDEVRLEARREPDRVVVEVTDSGPGIEPERLTDVFKPFHTSKPRGLGMGLALVKRAMERIGGGVEITSSPGCTCARLYLPCAVFPEGASPWRTRS